MSKKKDDGFLYYDENGLPLSNEEGQNRAEVRYEQEVIGVLDKTCVEDQFRHYYGIDQEVHDEAFNRLIVKGTIEFTEDGHWKLKEV